MKIQYLVLALLAINALTLLLYWQDKRWARAGGRRIPEGTLLLLALLGGSPAAFWGMKKFRHKTSKTSFRLRFWIIVLLQCGLLGYFLLQGDCLRYDAYGRCAAYCNIWSPDGSCQHSCTVGIPCD